MKNHPNPEFKTKLMPMATLLQIFLPRWFVVWLATVSGIIYYWVAKKRRQRIFDNMRHILGDKTSSKVLQQYTRRLFINYVICLVDLLRAPILTKEKLQKMVKLEGMSNFNQALVKGKGAVLITAHIGNWDLAGVFLSHLGYNLSAVVEPIPKGVTDAMNRYRGLGGMELIPLTDKDSMNRALEQKKTLVLLTDRDLTGHGFELPCFDARRTFPKGPAAFALKYGVPIILGYLILNRGKPYRGVVETTIDYNETGDFKQDVFNLTEIIAQRINRVIAQYPDQWFVFRADWR